MSLKVPWIKWLDAVYWPLILQFRISQGQSNLTPRAELQTPYIPHVMSARTLTNGALGPLFQVQ